MGVQCILEAVDRSRCVTDEPDIHTSALHSAQDWPPFKYQGPSAASHIITIRTSSVSCPVLPSLCLPPPRNCSIVPRLGIICRMQARIHEGGGGRG